MTAHVATVFGHYADPLKYMNTPELASNTRVGVEIELESLLNFTGSWTKKLFPYWVTTNDGSLRNHGKEFILGGNTPLFGIDIIDGLNLLEKTLDEYQTSYSHGPTTSKRTSLHLHVDVRDLTVKELLNFITLSYIFEDTLFKAFAPERKDNNYCMPFSSNNEIQRNYHSITQSTSFLTGVVNNSQKYSASNILSIAQKGSVEFRMMRATWDSKVILGWINLILCLRNYAKSEQDFDVSSLPERISSKGVLEWATGLFGDFLEPLKGKMFASELLKSIRKVEHMLHFKDLFQMNRSFISQGVRSTKLIDSVNPVEGF
jgi:hypothetical protein